MNKLLKQGPKESLGRTNNVLKGYLIGLGYGKLSGVLRPELQNRLVMHMERKNLWKLGENKANFLSSRGSNKRKRSKCQNKRSRENAKVLKKKKSDLFPVIAKSGSQKHKRKLSKEKYPAKKKKFKKDEEDEKLPERYLLPDELLFEKLLSEQKGYRINPIKRDGNCLFRAVADQVYDDPSLHAVLRNWCANYMQEHGQFLYSVISKWEPRFY